MAEGYERKLKKDNVQTQRKVKAKQKAIGKPHVT